MIRPASIFLLTLLWLVTALPVTAGGQTANGHPYQTVYTSGPLAGYTVVESLDGSGRRTGFQVTKGGVPVHTVSYGLTTQSGEIASVSLSGLSVAVGRDSNRRVTGFGWGASGIAQGWSRDGTGRITAAGSTGVSGAPSFGYSSFTPRGNRLNCTTAGGAWAYTYDTLGQLTSAVHPTLGTFRYTFDAVGRRTGYQVGAQSYTAANGGDPLNRFVQANRPQAKTLQISAAAGAQVWVNGEARTVTGGKASYALASPGPQGGWVNWTVRGGVTGAGEAGANPDALAETTGQTWFPPASESFVHDAAGNRQGSARWDYGWDSHNHLRGARTKDLSTAPEGWELAFEYDSEGRRFKKTSRHYLKGVLKEDTVTWFIWDGWDLVYERRETSAGTLLLERRYAWGPDLGGSPGATGGAGGLVVMRETVAGASPVTTDYYPLYDGTGHVIGLSKPDGTLAARYAYGPFGEPISATGPRAAANPFRFATKYLDTETGLYYFGQRYYDPGTGTWLSREPLGEEESVNLYAYCHNDPVNNVDALGLQTVQLKRQEDMNWLERAVVSLFETLTPTLTAQITPEPVRGRSLMMAGEFQRSVSRPLMSAPGNTVRAVGHGLAEKSSDAGAYLQATYDAGVPGGFITVGGGMLGGLISTTGDFVDPFTPMESSYNYFVVDSAKVFRDAGGGWNGFVKSSRHDLTAWNVEKAYDGFSSGDLDRGFGGFNATMGVVLFFLPEVKATPLRIAPFDELVTTTGQRHHLNQTAAYRDVIPRGRGLSIELEGNIFRDRGAPHTLAHQSLENFWNTYRGTDIVPTNLQYTRALQQSLRAAHLSDAQIKLALRAAIQERIRAGALGGMEVPRVPDPIRNIAR